MPDIRVGQKHKVAVRVRSVSTSRAAGPPTDATTPIPRIPVAPAAPGVFPGIALVCLAAVLLEAAADVLPDEPVFWVVTPVRLVILAGLAAVLLGGLRPNALRTVLDPAVLLLVVAAVLATVLGGQSGAPLRGLLTAVGAFYLAVGVRRAVPGSGPAIGLLALVAVAIAGGTAARQAAAGTATGYCRGQLDGTAGGCEPDALIRAVGTFANPNLLAAFLVLLVPLALAGAVGLADRSSRVLAVALVAVGYTGVLVSFSRGGILAAAAGVGVLVVLHRLTRARLLVSATAAALVAGVIVALSGGSVGIRSEVWTATVGLVVDNPLGVGLGRAGPLLDARIVGDEEFQHAHNLWLNWAAEAGLPGLLAVLALTVLVALVGIRAARDGSAVATAGVAGLAGLAVMSLADHPSNAIRISLALWLVLGLVAAEGPARWLPGSAARWLPGTDGPARRLPGDAATAGAHRRDPAQPSAATRSRAGSR